MKVTYKHLDELVLPGSIIKPKRKGRDGDVHITSCLNGCDSVVFENGDWRKSTEAEHDAAVARISQPTPKP